MAATFGSLGIPILVMPQVRGEDFYLVRRELVTGPRGLYWLTLYILARGWLVRDFAAAGEDC